MRHPTEDSRLVPFDLGRGPPVLLVHGFTGTPFEMRFLGTHLARHGFRAVGMRLPGHGVDPFALEQATATQWVNEARAELLRIGEGGRAHVVGLSMGALIAAILAADHPDRVSGLALCAPALRLNKVRTLMIGLSALRFFTPRLRFVSKGPSDLQDPLMRRRLPSIGRIPAAAVEQFSRVRTWARLALPKVQAPTVVVYSENDRTVPSAAAFECARLVGSRPVRMVRLERSSHVLTLDVERTRVAEEIERFIRALA
ncbi:MAG: alpha/beta fold hydrolase [Deltaproteobacteria bacterium]|nr:alpha/beta fold hydrolase [Deltaproteobacteria bacterium]